MKNSLKSLFFLAGAITLTSCSTNLLDSDSNKNLSLTSPPAPFAKKHTSEKIKAEKFKPIIKNNRIVLGNKTLQVNNDGTLGIYANGIRLAKLFYYFKTENYCWITLGDTKRFKTVSAKNDPSKGLFQYKGEFPLEKPETPDMPMGKYNQTVELLKDGRIKVDIKWTVPKKFEKCVTGNDYFIAFPELQLKGEKILLDDKEYFVPEEDKRVFVKKNPLKLTLFEENKKKIFDIELQECYRTLCSHRNNEVYIRLTCDRSKKHLSYILDITRGLKNIPSKDTYAGIDFQKVEDLELPNFEASRNLMRNPSFEQGLKGYRHGSGYIGHEVIEKKWDDLFSEDTDEKKFGESSLKIKTFCKREKDYRGLVKPGNITSLPVPLDPGKYTLSFYAKGNRCPGQNISVWCPKISRASLPFPGGKKKFTLTNKWKRYSLNLNIPISMPFQVNFNAESQNTTDGCVWVDGIQLEKGDKLTSFATRPVEGRLITSRPDNFLSSKDKINAKLKITGKAHTSGKAKVTVKNFFSEKVFEDEFDFSTGKNGKVKIDLPFEDKFGNGIYVLKTEYLLENGQKSYDICRFSIMDFLENKHRLKNIFSSTYGIVSPRANFLKILERWKKIGIGAKNHMHIWNKKVADLYKSYGVDLTDYGMMDLFNVYENGKRKRYFLISTWRESNLHPPENTILIRDFRVEKKKGELTKDYLKRFKKAVETVAKKYPWIKMWCFGGEMGAKWPDLAGDSASDKEFSKFVKLQIAFYEGVKEGNPGAKVFNGDPCNMSPRKIKLLDRLLTGINGKIKYDLIGIHAYRATPENPDLESDIKELLKMLEKHGYTDTPVFLPEGMHWGPYNIPQWGIVSATWGPPRTWYFGALSYDMGWTEKVTAAWRARSWLVALKHQNRIKSFMSSSACNNFELDMYLTPFATQKIPNTLGNLLGDAKFKKDIRFAPYIRCYVFEDAEKRPVAAVWCYHPELDAGKMEAPIAEASFEDQDFEIFDLMQTKRIPPETKNGKIAFPVSSFPIFFRGKPGSLDKMIKSFENASLISGEGISPVNIAGKPVSPENMRFKIQNMLSRKFNGTMSVNGIQKKIQAPASGSTSVEFNIPEKLKANKIVEEKIQSVLESGKSRFCNDLTFEGFISRKVTNPIKVDGQTDDWKGIPAIKFTKPYISDRKLKRITNKDFSGKFRTAWDEKGIYICVEIKDDKFVHKAFAKTGRRWSNDCLQIYFDTLCDARLREKRGYDNNDYSYAVFPDSKGQNAVFYRYLSPDRQLTMGTEAPPDNVIEPEIKPAFKKTSDGYIYEVFIPAKFLLPIKLEKGYAIGFGLYAADCDDNKAEYPGRVKSALTLAPWTGCYNKPHLWPVMLLWE